MIAIGKASTIGFAGALGQGVTFLSMPVMTRLYTPDAFGGWAIFVSLASVIGVASALRYEVAVVLAPSNEEASTVVLVCIGISVLTSVFAWALVETNGRWILGGIYFDQLKSLLWCTPLITLCMGICGALQAWFIRTEEFVWYALMQVLLPFLTLLTQILCAKSGWNGPEGLVIGTALGQCGAALAGFTILLAKYSHIIWVAISPREILKVLVKYKNYPLYMTPYTFLGTMRERLIYLLLGAYGGGGTAGYYNLASRFVNAPNSLISGALRPVYFQKASSSEFSSLEQPITRLLYILTIITVPFSTFFIIYAGEICSIIFGEVWADAGSMAAILMIPTVPLLLGNWLDRSFDVLGRQRLALVLESAFSLAAILVVVTGMIGFSNVMIAVCLQAGVTTLYYSFWIYVLFRVAGFRTRWLWKLVLIVASLASVTCGITYCMALILSTRLQVYVIPLVLAVLVAVFLKLLWRHDFRTSE